MPFCSQCQGEVPQEAAFCRHCGSSLGTPLADSDNSTQGPKDIGGRKLLKWGGIGCGGLLAIFIILVIVVAIFSTDTEEPIASGADSAEIGQEVNPKAVLSLTTAPAPIAKTVQPTVSTSTAFPTAAAIVAVLPPPEPSLTPIPTEVPAPRITAMPIPTPTATPTPTPTPTVTPTPTPIPTLTPTPTPTPTVMPTPTPPPTLTPTPSPTLRPLNFELSDLLKEYESNKVLANTRYRYVENGKFPITVSGYVLEVEDLYVTLVPDADGSWFSDEVKCHYSDIREALHLRKGQKVTITGRVSGESYGDVVMFQCDVWEVHLDRNPYLQAHQVANNTVKVFCIPAENLGSFFFGSPQYEGTGVILDSELGIVLTAHHVVREENECKRIEIESNMSSSRIIVNLENHCASIDRAVLRISADHRGLFRVPVLSRASAPAQADQEVYFWGYGTGALRLEKGIVEDRGFFSGQEFTIGAHAISGDSGSPAFDEYGHLVGIVTRSNSSDRASVIGGTCYSESH